MRECLTDDSEVVQMLRKGLTSGQIYPDATAKLIWPSNEKFQVYRLGTFQTRLNKIKQELNEGPAYAKRLVYCCFLNVFFCYSSSNNYFMYRFNC